MAHDFGMCHLSVGNVLRDICAREDRPPDESILEHVRAGTLVPVEKLSGILFDAISRNKEKGCRKFLIDGFPRSVDQADFMERQVSLNAFRDARLSADLESTENLKWCCSSIVHNRWHCKESSTAM